MLNIAICDDEPDVVNELETRTRCFFAQKGTEAEIAKFYDGGSLLESCAEADYDIIFLDIKMNAPQWNGNCPPAEETKLRRVSDFCYGSGGICF